MPSLNNPPTNHRNDATLVDPSVTRNDEAIHLESLIQSYHAQLGPLEKKGTAPHPGRHVVLLTGSTGALGSHILADLLKDDRVLRVYILNRSGSASVYDRQLSSFKQHGLDETLLSSDKFVSLEGDLTDGRLGLPSSRYEELVEMVTLVIHNAWKVDFRSPIAKFEPSLKGGLNLINFARGSRSLSLRFLFISSVMSMQNLSIDATVPADIVLDAGACLGTGYGESKYIVERLLASSGIEACSIRIAQLYGDNSQYAWPVTGWLPYIVATGVEMRQLPLPKGSTTWLPMDFAAKAALDIALYRGVLPLAINVVHPTPALSSSVFAAIRDAIYERSQGRISLPFVPLKQWLLNLHAYSESGESLRKLPALKLLRLFEHVAEADHLMDDRHELGRLPTFDTTSAQQLSLSLKDARPLAKDVVYTWVDYWIHEGLLAGLTPRHSPRL